MKFKATTEQIKKVAALAVNASRGAGMGMLHFRPKTYTPEEIDLQFTQFDFEKRVKGNRGQDVDLDYYEGRMVKLHIRALGEDAWEVTDSPPRPDYQSWADTYPTYPALLRAAGITL